MTAMTYTKNIRSEQGENYMTSQHWSFDDSTQTNKSQTHKAFLGTSKPKLHTGQLFLRLTNSMLLQRESKHVCNCGAKMLLIQCCWDAASTRIVPNHKMHLTNVISGRKRSSLFSISRPGSQGTSKAPGTGELMTVDLQGPTGITKENLTTQESTLQIIHL